MSPSAGVQERVRRVVAEHETAVTSKQVAAELFIGVGYATHILAALVDNGVIDVRNGQGGCYEWTPR